MACCVTQLLRARWAFSGGKNAAELRSHRTHKGKINIGEKFAKRIQNILFLKVRINLFTFKEYFVYFL